MKTYKSLDYLTLNNIDFKYTPFDQGALVDVLSPEWLGACNALSNEWMLRKISQENMQDVTTYEITQPHLPHPVVTITENETADKEIAGILKKEYKSSQQNQFALDHPKGSKKINSLDNSIESLLNFIDSNAFHYGVIRTGIYILQESRGDLPQSFGHAISFVKRGNEISWFDPNYGEITFASTADFKIWFRDEVKNGVLNFIINPGGEKNYKTLADIFPQPTFTQEQMANQDPLSAKIIERRTEAQEIRSAITNFMVTDYEISSFYGEEYINPLKKMQETELAHATFVPYDLELDSLRKEVAPTNEMQGMDQKPIDKTTPFKEEFKKIVAIDHQPLIEVIMAFCKKHDKVDGLQKMQAIIGNKNLKMDDKIDQLIHLAEWKKSDSEFTQLLHNKMRGREPEVEIFYQRLAALKTRDSESVKDFKVLFSEIDLSVSMKK